MEACHGAVTCDGIKFLALLQELRDLNISYIMEVNVAHFIDPFHDTGFFLHPLKTSEDLYKKRPAAWNRLIETFLMWVIRWLHFKVSRT